MALGFPTSHALRAAEAQGSIPGISDRLPATNANANSIRAGESLLGPLTLLMEPLSTLPSPFEKSTQVLMSISTLFISVVAMKIERKHLTWPGDITTRGERIFSNSRVCVCLLYTSDAADD